MTVFRRVGSLVVASFLLVAALASPAAAAAAPGVGTCTANLHIFTTSAGTQRQAGTVLLVKDSGVGGAYTSGFLNGYVIAGAQDTVLNTSTNQSELRGQFIATGRDGTLTIKY